MLQIRPALGAGLLSVIRFYHKTIAEDYYQPMFLPLVTSDLAEAIEKSLIEFFKDLQTNKFLPSTMYRYTTKVPFTIENFYLVWVGFRQDETRTQLKRQTDAAMKAILSRISIQDHILVEIADEDSSTSPVSPI